VAFEIYLETIRNSYLLRWLIVFTFFLILSKLFIYISEKFLRRWTKKTETDLDDKLIHIIESPLALILLLIGIKIAFSFSGAEFDFLDSIDRFLDSLIIITIGYFAFVVANLFVKLWAEKFAKKTRVKIDDDLLPLIHKTLKGIILIITFMVLLNKWGVNIAPMLASLGIAGLALGLALQSTLSNIFSGVALIFDRAFKVGDIVEIDKVMGIVHDIGLRSTRIKTFNNEIIAIPNGQLANCNIKNFLQPDARARIIIPFTVAYGTDHKKVKKIVSEVIKKLENVDPEHLVHFDNMGGSALEFKAYFWVKSYKHKFETKEKAICEIYDALNKSKIVIPFPQMDIHLKK